MVTYRKTVTGKGMTKIRNANKIKKWVDRENKHYDVRMFATKG